MSHLTFRISRIAAPLFACVLGLFALASCGNMSEKELQTTCASGVVMVQNRSYYEIRIPGMESLYFTSFDSNDDIEDLTEDLDDIKPSEGYGTGFFVSKDGKIVTNNHVVSGENKKEAVSEALNQRISYILSSYIQSYQEVCESEESAENELEYFDGDDTELMELQRNTREECATTRQYQSPESPTGLPQRSGYRAKSYHVSGQELLPALHHPPHGC